MSLEKTVSQIGCLATLLLTFSLAPAQAQVSVTCTVPNTAQVNAPYLGASCSASGGVSPYVYSVTAGALPGGLALNTSTGAITGSPTTAGNSYTFTVTASDSSTPSVTGSTVVSNFVVKAALSLNCTLPQTAVVNAPYTGASCSGAGGTPSYSYSISAGSLPLGLSLNSSTGVISGTPSTAGSTYTFTVQVTDSNPTPQNATYPVSNFPVAAALTLTCTFPAAQVNVVYPSAGCSAQGGNPAYTYSISAGSLPPGLSLNTSTGAVTGTPTTAGSYSFTEKVTDSSPTPLIATHAVSNLVVAAGLTLTCTLPTAEVGVVYTGASCSASGGTPGYTYSINAGSLPPGLSLNTSTGAITGTPTTAGTAYAFTVQVQDSSTTPQTASQPQSNFVVAAALSLSCTLPANATVNVSYTGAGCSAQGGVSPLTYSISAGTLPPGLGLNTSTGAITGTPTAAGTNYAFTVQVADSYTTPQTANHPVSNFVVVSALTLNCTLPSTAEVGVSYSGAGCSVQGGTSPYTYSISAGSLPPGLSLNSSTGAITGTPTAAGTNYAFTVQVQDSNATPQTASHAVSNFVVVSALTLTCTLPSTAQVGVSYLGAGCSAQGGVSPLTYSISAGTLPPGLSLNTSTGAITGTPTAAGTNYTFTVQVTDSNATPQTATHPVSNFVVVSALTLTCTLPSTAEVGVSYSGAGCSAQGGTSPYAYSISAGSLPPGLSLNTSTGAIIGTPTSAGTSSFTVKATDNSATQQSATYPVSTFIVNAAPSMTCTAPTQAVVGSAYSANCNASGGIGSYTYSVSVGSLPSGLSLNTSTGAITGTPTAAGSFSFTIKVADGANQSTTQALAVTVFAQLKITTATLSNGTVGIAYSASCAASGGQTPYSFSISAGALPTGLSMNSATCAITGNPSAAGTFNFSVKVTDTENTAQSATQPLSITVSPALAITSLTAPNGSVGLAYTFLLIAQNGTPSYSWSIVSGSLPAGLSLNSSTGLISGTPTTAGSYSFTAKVTDSGSPAQTQTQTFSNVSIAAGLTITTTSLSNGLVGSSYTGSLAAQNGTAPYTWSIVSGSLPSGLSINGSSISGTPTSPGIFNFTVRVTDSSSPTAQVAQQALSISISSVLTLNASTLPGAVVGVSYSASCSASGGTQPYTFSLLGSLPTGLNLNATNCTINGIPTGSPGTSNFTIKVADASNPSQSVSQGFSITVSAGLAITSTSVPGGSLNSAYSFQLVAQNGVTPYGWALTAGALPSGLTLTGGGLISGTPTSQGTYSFTVRVTDSSSQSATQTFTLTVGPATLTLSCNLPGGAQVGISYSSSAGCTASGGTPAFTFSVSSGALPAGLTLNSTTGVISGTPTTPGNSFAFTLKVTDSATPAQTATYPVTNFVVLPASAPVPPTFTFVGVPSSQTPGSTITGDTLSLGTSSVAWPVTISLSFTPNAVNGATDPAMQFIDSAGNKLGTSYTLTVPALTNSVNLPQINPGTVEGKVNLSLSVSGQTGASTSFNVPASIPIISAGSVQVLNITSSGFDVEVIASSSPRDLKSATFTFNAAANAVLNGTTAYTVDVSSLMTSWYASSASQQYGSLFLLTVPFPFTGSSSAIGSVTVTLTNSVGTSASVTGAF